MPDWQEKADARGVTVAAAAAALKPQTRHQTTLTHAMQDAGTGEGADGHCSSTGFLGGGG
jgi:hypothetical protein